MVPADTVNATPLLATPPTVTTTFPVVAPAGTGTTMLVAGPRRRRADRAVEGGRARPLVAPKLAPVIVTAVPTGPLVGARLVMLGGTVRPR